MSGPSRFDASIQFGDAETSAVGLVSQASVAITERVSCIHAFKPDAAFRQEFEPHYSTRTDAGMLQRCTGRTTQTRRSFLFARYSTTS